MKAEFFNDDTMMAIEAYMTRLSQRYQVVASNVANFETPGYKAKEISFYATMEELLSEDSVSLRTSQPEHISPWASTSVQAQVFEEQGLPLHNDGNNVDLDREMMKVSQTLFGYSVISQVLRTKFRTLSTSINDGRV